MITIFVLVAEHERVFIGAALVVSVVSSWTLFRQLAAMRYGGGVSAGGVAIVVLSAALGVWATHFIAMLGYRPDLALSFEAEPTLWSLAIAIVFISLGALTAGLGRRWWTRYGGALLLGGAISAMHAVGMQALGGCIVTVAPAPAGAATLAAMAISAAAMRALHSRLSYGPLLAAGLFTLGVLTLHFGSLSGVSLTFTSLGAASGGIATDELAMIQSAVAVLLVLPLFVSIARQVAESREAQRAGRVALATGEGVLALDRMGRVRWANRAFELLHGLVQSEIIGEEAAAILGGADSTDDSDKFRAALAAGAPARLTLACMPDGALRWHEVRLEPVRRADGVLEEFVTVHRDVTGEREALRQLAAAEERAQRLALVAKHANDAILILDSAGRMTWANRAFEVMSGYSLVELVGARPGALLRGADSDPATGAAIDQAFETRQAIRTDFLIYAKSCEASWTDIEISPVSAEGEELFIGVCRDVTERVRREEALVEARRLAEAADKTKGEFLARISHELRTPLNGVTGMAELLAHAGLDERQARFLSVIRASSEDLRKLVDDILGFSQVEAGTLQMKSAPLSLGDVVAETAALIAPQAEAKGLRVETRIDLDLPARVIGDERRLRQILLNLAGNAAKFTETGEIGLSARRIEPDLDCADACGVRLEVADTGPGVAAHMRSEIFKEFAQADGSARRAHQGAGLGLSIARGLAEAMGGRIGVTPRDAIGDGMSGSVFWVELVLPPAALASQESACCEGAGSRAPHDRRRKRRIAAH